jgi:tight adherence protein B
MDLTLLLIFGGGILLVLLLIGVIIEIRENQSLLEERIDHFAEQEFEDKEKEPEDQASVITEWLERQLEGSSMGDRIATNLAQADIKLRSAEYLALMIILAVGLGTIAWLIGRQNPISALIGIGFGLFLPRIYVNRQKDKRLDRFNGQLPDMLNLTVNGLRAGYSTMQALEAVSREMPPPISDEFRRIVQEMQLGLSMEDALDNLHRRIPSDDLDLIITAINVQREVGGNLAEILDVISYTIRERIRIKGEIKVLVAQVVYSGRFLALLPFGLAILLWFINPDYMMTLFEPQNRLCGIIMLGTAAIMVGLGYFAMMKVADIEV